MRPKTQLQIEVDRLSRKVKRLTRDQRKWIEYKLFPHYLYRTKTRLVCLECGHEWSLIFNGKCPKCHKELTVLEGKTRSSRDVAYFHIFEVIGRFQVVRYFHVTKHSKVGTKADEWVNEVCQHWITPDGKSIVRGVSRGMNGWGYNDGWSLCSVLEIRNARNYHYINQDQCYPGITLLPEIYRNGYDGQTHGLNSTFFFSLILSSSHAETLLKTKQFALFEQFEAKDEEIDKYWPQVLICLRHNYMITKGDIWLDHVKMLEENGYDIHNPKYICPANLDKAHQRLIKKVQEKERKRELEELKAEIEESNKKYQQTKSKYFGLKFSRDGIDVVVLDNVRDFYLEGSQMHHCVFSQRYYERENSLILSARRKEKRLETIELSLSDYSVIQSRGNNNKSSRYHNKIIQLVNDNIKTIKRAKVA